MKFFATALLVLGLCAITTPVPAGTLKIATLSPEGSMWMEKMREGAAVIAEQTEGRVKFKFYPGGVMGNDTVVLKKMHIGQLHGGALVAGSLTGHFPGNQVYSQLMIFDSLEEVDHVRQKMDPYIEAGLEEAGLVTLGLAGGGFAFLMSKEPFSTIEDLKRRKLWIPDDNAFTRELVGVFGISPIPLSLSDVRTGLQTGLIDTVATTPSAALVLQWHTQIKYLVEIPFIYIYAALVVSKKAFDDIDPKDREILSGVIGRKFKEIEDQNRKDDIRALETLRDRDIVFISPDKKELARWKEKSRETSEALVEKGLLPEDAVRALKKHLQEYHAAPSSSTDS